MTRMITAMFDTRAEADAAVDHLARDIGIQRSAGQVHGGEATAGTPSRSTSTAGAEDVTFWSALRDLFVPDEDRPTYAEGIRRGSFLVTADVEDTAVDSAMDLLEAHGAVDLDTREAQWRAGGWSGQGAETGTVTSLPTAPELGVVGTTHEKTTECPGGAGGDFTTNPAPGQMDSVPKTTSSTTPTTDEVIPVVEERLQVGKRDVERGRVRVRSYIVERPVSEQVTLRGEYVEV